MGGNVYSVSKVNESLVDNIVRCVRRDLRIPHDVIEVVGSSRIKQLSNDIDIAVDEKYVTADNLYEYVTKESEREHSSIKQCKRTANTLNMLYEYGDGYYQIDIIVGDIKWLPVYYKGDINGLAKDRNKKLAEIARNTIISETSELDDYGRPVHRTRYSYGPKNGLCVVYERSKYYQRHALKLRDRTYGEKFYDLNKIRDILFHKDKSFTVEDMFDLSKLNKYASTYIDS